MRAFIYDLLVTDPAMQTFLDITEAELATRVIPRRSRDNINLDKPFIVYGLGNSTDEDLADSTAVHQPNAERQFFQVWFHDEGGDFDRIDVGVEIIKKRLRGASSIGDQIMTIQYLETSQEFNNETYNTNFRYIRFQAIRAKVGTPS